MAVGSEAQDTSKTRTKQKKISKLSSDRQNEKDINEYMIDKLQQAISVYDQVHRIARDYCDDRDSGGES